MAKRTSALSTIVGCLAVQLCVGILYLWSVFRSPVAAYYQWSEGAANMVASVMMMTFVGGNFLGGALQDRTNPKLIAVIGSVLFCLGVFLTSLLTPGTINLIYFTYCVMGGLGAGFTYGSVLSCLQKWMPHRMGLASGLAVSAFGLSTVVFSPVSSALLARFAVPTVFRILSIVFFVLAMGACCLIRLPDEGYLAALPKTEGKAVSGRESVSPLRAVRTVPFWCVFFSIFFVNGVWNVTVPLIKDLGVARGLSAGAAVATVSITGLTNAMGRLIMSALSDKVGRYASNIFLCLLNAGCAFLLLAVGGFPYAVVVAVLAFAYGGPSAINPALTTDLFGPKYSGTNYGLAMLALGLSSLFFNGLATALNNIYAGLIISGVCALLPIPLLLVIRRCAAKEVKV